MTSTSVAPPTAPVPGPVHELKTLVLSRHAAIVVETAEEERLDEILGAVASELRLAHFEWTVTGGLVRLPGGAAAYGTQDAGQAIRTIGDLGVDGLFVLKDAGPHLTTPQSSRALVDLLDALAAPSRLSTLVLAGAQVQLPPDVEARAVRYDLALPTRDEYRRTVSAVVESLAATARARVDLRAEDVDALAISLTGLTLNQARQAVARAAIEDGTLNREDIPRLAQLKAEALADDGLLEYFPPADNRYELGGFGSLARWLERARVAFTPQAAALNLDPPKGLMLVGVQGCGKSLAAKVIARQWQLPLLKLDAGRLFDKFVGESEKNFRRAISVAESMAPAVLWIDEIEKGMAQVGGDSDGGLSRRLFGSFLTWMQEKRGEVFVVATANDISRLPPELLRKGRFDEIFFVDLPEADERQAIFGVHLRLRRQDPASFDMARLAAASEGFSGAEIEQAVVAALLRALQEQRPLDTELVVHELGATVPLSVSRREDVQRLQAFARDRFVPVR
jgi:ATPase family associated with various cellular activities (AAA)/AAA+ lid domain